MKIHRALLAALAIAAAPSAARAEPPLRVDLGGGTTLELVLVPAGSFTQGSPEGEKGREADERQRSVKITEPYYMGKYPVTVGQWKRFSSVMRYRSEAERGASGGSGWDGKQLVQKKEFNWQSPGFPQTDDHPVTLVTYDDAIAFVNWLSRTAGRTFSLPTEAQWEHAYRAGGKGAFYQGTSDKDALDLGWFKANAGQGTMPVGKKKPNAFGLFDMAGNVFEWCADFYAPYADGSAVDPRAAIPDASDKPRRVLRGGSWLKDPKHGRAAARYRNTPGSRNADNGFRVVAAHVADAPKPSPASTPPAPPAPNPPVTPPPPSNNRSAAPVAWGVLGCTGTIAIVLIAMVVLLVRRGSSSKLRFRKGPDGFWILAPRELRGATLHYRFRGATGPQEGQVVLEPSDVGQFVYTGAPPASVEEVRLLLPHRPAPAQSARAAQSGRSARSARHAPQARFVGSSQSAPPVEHHHHYHHHHHHHHHDSHQHYEPSRTEPEPFAGYPSAY